MSNSPAENPDGYCPIHATGVKLPDDFVVTPLQFVDRGRSATSQSRPVVRRPGVYDVGRRA